MSNIVLISNRKGGVGKTTITCNLAVGLAQQGFRVGVVDTDPQGHCSYQFSILDETGYPYEGLFNLIVNAKQFKLDVHDLVIEVMPKRGEWAGSVHLLPGGAQTALAAIDMQMKLIKYAELGKMLAPFTETCDYVLVDTAPAVSLLAPSLLAMADYILIPSDMARYDVLGVNAIVQEMVSFYESHHAQLLGIVPTKTQPRTGEHMTQLNRLVADYPGYVWNDVQLSLSTLWKQASDAKASIFEWANPDHSAHKQMQALVDKFVIATSGAIHERA